MENTVKQKEEIKTHSSISEQHSSLSSVFSCTSSEYSKSLSPEFTGTGLKCFQSLKEKSFKQSRMLLLNKNIM